MKRNLKVFGLAMVAAFAMSAVAASGASALDHGFVSDGPSTTLDATALSNQVFKATPSDTKEVVCKKVSVKGSIAKETVVEVTVEPIYSECSIWETKANSTETIKELASASVSSNGCHYLFTGKTDANGHAETHISCPVGKTGITVKVSALQRECIHVPEQTVKGVHYDNGITAGVTDIKVTATVENIESETTDQNLVCDTPSGGTEKHSATGKYKGEVTVTGTNPSTGAATSISLETVTP